MKRDLSPAEEQGWRRYWDGWILCPTCVAKELGLRRIWDWPVPANYDTPIGEADDEYDPVCAQCGALPPLLLTARTAA